MAQFPWICGTMRLRPPCSEGSSRLLTRTDEEYKLWKLAGRGGGDEDEAALNLRRLDGRGDEGLVDEREGGTWEVSDSSPSDSE